MNGPSGIDAWCWRSAAPATTTTTTVTLQMSACARASVFNGVFTMEARGEAYVGLDPTTRSNRMNFLITLALMTTPFGAEPKVDYTAVAALAGKASEGDADALAKLRAMGPEGLDALMQIRSELS